MNFDRFCGMASAAVILLILALNAWLGLFGPVWKAAWEMKPGDALGVIVAVIGWIVTLGVGTVAFFLSQRQIKLGRSQIELQQRQIDMQQQQIAEAREEARRSNHARLEKEFLAFAGDLDRLKLVQGYLGTFTGHFPNGALDGWSVALIRVSQNADDFISYSATSAPFGYGERVLTVMNRIKQLGEQLMKGTSPATGVGKGTLMRFDPLIKSAIEGIRNLETEIRQRIPKLEKQLIALADERDTYASR
jgi:hypothetical protein